MQKYSEIISLNKHFQPYYDITNESADYWKSFIPNDKFYTLLTGVLNSLDGTKAQDRKSIWIQGTYGTGKSHATGVIKQILYNTSKDVDDYINNFSDDQLKSRVKKYRKKNKVLPVVLKGVSNIFNNSSFSLEIEKSVKRALNQNNIKVQTESDFEKMIRHIDENPMHINWDEHIDENPELRMYISNKNELISKLKNNDSTILQILEDLSSKTQTFFSHENIENWLRCILKELQAQNLANKMVIYWDEFTSVLELQNTGILLSKLQDIAELSVEGDIYLYVVSHRRPHQSQLAETDIEHILGRFTVLDYAMEPITTYHIIGAAIKKHDKQTWQEQRDQNIPLIKDTINKITSNDGVLVKELIKDLFPIHPYTAYLSTFIARNIGSTERSIFNFLYDEKRGFTKFINECPGEKETKYLTADYLFDFFLDEFENNTDQRYSSVLDKYRLYVERMEQHNNSYLLIFKVLLLLNILYRVVSVDESSENLVSPNLSNLKSIFAGTKFENQINQCLDYVDNEQIISRNPDNLYLVENSALPHREIDQAINELKSTYNSIDKILNDEHKNSIKEIFSLSILRNNEITFIDGGLNEHLIKNRLLNSFNNDYSIHIVLFISKSIEEQSNSLKNIKNILQEEQFENIVFVSFNEILESDLIEKYIEYQGRALVANRHNLQEDEINNSRYAKKLIEQWINKIKSSSVKWYIRLGNNVESNNNIVLLSNLYEVINNELAIRIFNNGLETIKSATDNFNAWTPQMSKTIAEYYILADNRQYLEQRTSAGPAISTREILKDNNGQYIVNDKLKLVYQVDPDHPIKKMSNEISQIIDMERGEVVNIGIALKFLASPPYGLYPNMINIAAFAFLMREYSSKLYEAGTGRPIEKLLLKDLVCNIFEYWKTGRNANKLDVRLGTEEEKSLINDLCNIFNLKNIESLNDAKWAIREWIKEKAKFPLWVFNYYENTNDEVKEAIYTINYFIESVDREFTPEMIAEAISSIEPVKTDLIMHLQRHTQCKSFFIKWMDSIDNLNILKNQYDDIIKYVRENMPEEVGVASWSEAKVRELVKDWFIEKPISTLKAVFIYKLQSEYTPVTVQFIDQSEGNPIAWEWSFDTNNPEIFSNEQYPTYTYEKEGSYTVSLTVTDKNGKKDIHVIDDPINILKKPPIDLSLKDNVIKKIETYSGDLKKVIIQFINDHEELISVIDKYIK